jgi:beta-1,4-mannosyl-glycoprotein beta-1,4-N-acetylglucosaminyltransferase
MIWDTFPMNDELDMLEARLYELEGIPDLRHVIVEADVTHQDRPKPSHYLDNAERFAPWKDRIVHVWATGLPTVADNPDPWAREHAQREHAATGLTGASGDDVVLHGDLDEIPTVVAVRNVRPTGMIAFEQRGHFWSCRWLYGLPWFGTVAARAKNIRSFGAMRDTRNIAPSIPGAGWHLSWLGGPEVALRKVGNFCHPEVEDRIVSGLATNRFLVEGYHVDGVKMTRCEIDASFPRYVREGRCPESWLI